MVQNGLDTDESLFEIKLFEKIFDDYAKIDSKLHGHIYDDKYLLRPLMSSDFHHGYIELLRQLTDCGNITAEGFQQQFKQMKQCGNTYYILVLQDLHTDQQIVGSATLICELKFIRELATRGRIEDVVIHDRCRGQQLGKLLLELVTRFARDVCDCYKVSLECRDPLVKFYQQFGYSHEDKQNYLCQRFKHFIIHPRN